MSILRPRAKRSVKEPLWKSLYLTDSQYINRLVSHPSNGPSAKNFELLYERLKEMRPEIASAFNVYLISFAAVLLSRFHLLSAVETPGLKIASGAIQHVLLLSWADFQFKLSYLFAKHAYVAAIFDEEANKLPPTGRALFLAKYPFAFFILRYYPAAIGNLPHMFTPGFPVKAILALLFTIIALLLYFSVSTWLFVATSIDLWRTPTSIAPIASKGVIAGAAAFAIASWLLPANWFLKRRYTHAGLVTLMSRFHERNRPRWAYFVHRIDAAQKQLGIKQ